MSPKSRPFPDANARLSLRLYVAGRLVNSTRAIENLKRLCAQHLDGGRYQLEVVDVLHEPLRAVADQVLVTPTLVRLAPAPRIELVGDLSDPQVVLAALGIAERPA
ncbi:MAG: circadian clock KaiB family protein [Deltaproteobacteria bacterium]|nr:circadian clock KaiB family protein [Deltaproteobacteria bacterium]